MFQLINCFCQWISLFLRREWRLLILLTLALWVGVYWGKHQILESSEPAPQTEHVEQRYWITTSTHKTHNATCRFYKSSRGYYASTGSGNNCQICGGDLLGTERTEGKRTQSGETSWFDFSSVVLYLFVIALFLAPPLLELLAEDKHYTIIFHLAYALGWMSLCESCLSHAPAQPIGRKLYKAVCKGNVEKILFFLRHDWKDVESYYSVRPKGALLLQTHLVYAFLHDIPAPAFLLLMKYLVSEYQLDVTACMPIISPENCRFLSEKEVAEAKDMCLASEEGYALSLAALAERFYRRDLLSLMVEDVVL